MTWEEFRLEVGHLLTVDEKRKALDNYKDKVYRAAVIKLQDYIPYYRQRHLTTFDPTAMPVMESPPSRIVQDQGDTTEVLPSISIGAVGRIQDVRIRYAATETCNEFVRPVVPYPWHKRHALFTGCIGDLPDPVMTISPNRLLYIYPELVEGQTLEVYWEGIRKDFEDTTVVPWGEEACECVAAYIKSRIAREVDKDLQLSQSYETTFRKERQELYLRNKTRDELVRR